MTAVGNIMLTAGPHLFIDEHFIDTAERVEKVLHPPQRVLDRPVLSASMHRTCQPFLKVVRDESSGRLRMWYNPGGRRIGHSYSDDGINWSPPTPAVFTSGPENNKDACSVIDEGADYPHPQRRFKLAWHSKRLVPSDRPGLYVAFSADGLVWNPFPESPVLPDFASRDDAFPEYLTHPQRAHGVADIVDVYRDPIRGRYGLFCKTPALPHEGYARAPRAYTFHRRLVSASASDDFLHWQQPRRVIVPEERDEGLIEFYSVGGTLARGDLLIGFVRILRDDLSADPDGPADGIGYTALATSRDGVNWQRHDGIFFDRGNGRGDWDGAFAWIGCALPMGDELWLYYGGYRSGHKIEPFTERQIGLVKMPIDRWVSRRAGAAGGTLTTRPIRFPRTTAQITLNASASAGRIRAALLDEAGQELAGFGVSDCAEIRSSGLALPLSWKTALRVPDHPIRLYFEMHNADLFGFTLIE